MSLDKVLCCVPGLGRRLFQVVVAPGPTTSSTCEAEGDASPSMDALTEAVAGMTGYFNIQVMQYVSLDSSRLEPGIGQTLPW